MLEPIAVALILAVVLCPAASGSDDAPSIEELVGVWKLAYSPGLPDVLEVDEGYLVLSPDMRFTKVTSQIDEARLLVIDGRFEIDGTAVVLHRESARYSDGSSVALHERVDRLHLLRKARVVFFDDQTCTVETRALGAGAVVESDDLNYTWGQAFGGAYGLAGHECRRRTSKGPEPDAETPRRSGRRSGAPALTGLDGPPVVSPCRLRRG